MLAIAGYAVLALVLVSAISWIYYALNPVTIVDPPPGPIALQTLAIPDGPQAAMLREGRAAVIASDCVSCHTRAGGHPFEGGLGLQTPFGTIYSANLTGDRKTGLGDWTPDQFHAALTRGIGYGGRHIYPALPYTHFAIMPRATTDAMLAWLKTVPARSYTPPANRLPFPLDLRPLMIGWNALFFHPHPFRPDAARSAAWNRGAYIVQGPGHCGSCHTPLNVAGAEKTELAFRGARLNDWVAPDLTGNPRTGLGRWSAADIVEYLKTGRNLHSSAGASMAEVVTYSTSNMPDSDRVAIATYLKSLSPSPDAAAEPRPAPAAMTAGAAIFSDACASCHYADGRGQPKLFPPIPGSAVAQQGDATGLIHLILAGGRTAPTPTRPSFTTMPSFAWKLDDGQVAAVATYVRNAWGNRAGAVSEQDVRRLRRRLKLVPPIQP